MTSHSTDGPDADSAAPTASIPPDLAYEPALAGFSALERLRFGLAIYGLSHSLARKSDHDVALRGVALATDAARALGLIDDEEVDSLALAVIDEHGLAVDAADVIAELLLANLELLDVVGQVDR